MVMFIKNCIFSFEAGDGGEEEEERFYHPSNVIYHYYLFVEVNNLKQIWISYTTAQQSM